MTKGSHVAVVGGGAIGLMVAHTLSRRAPELRVTVFDPGDNVRASAAAGAMIAPFSEVTASSASRPDHSWRLKIARQAAAQWRELLSALEERHATQLITADGMYVVGNTIPTKLVDDNFAAIVHTLEMEGGRYSSIGPDEVPGMNPAWHARPTKAIFIEEEFTVDAQRVLASLTAELLAAQQVQIVRSAVRPELSQNGRLLGVVDADGELHPADAVVVCAGAWSRDLMPGHVRRTLPPLVSGAGTALVVTQPTPPIPQPIRTPNEAFACGLHVVPLPDNRLYIGATNLHATKPVDTAMLYGVNYLPRAAQHQVSTALAATRLLDVRVGNRPISLDLQPVIGRTDVDGLVIATGTQREGLTLSPVIADYVAELVLDEATEAVDHWNPQRPPQQAWTAEDAIAEAARQRLCAIAETETRFENPFMYNSIPPFVEENYRQLYQSMPDGFVLPPELTNWYSDDPGTARSLIEEYLGAWERRSQQV